MEMADHVRMLREQGLAVPPTIRSLPITDAVAVWDATLAFAWVWESALASL